MFPFYENNGEKCKIIKFNSLTFPEHIHSHIEYKMLKSGQLHVIVSGKEYLMKEGDFCAIFPYYPHNVYTNKEEKNSGFNLIAPASYAGSYYRQITNLTPVSPIIPAEQVHPDIRYIMERLENRHANYIDEKLAAVMTELITGRILQCLPMEKNTYKDSYDLTYLLIDYITKNYLENLTLDSLSKTFGDGKSHLSYIFSNRLGTNFRDFLNSFRISKSCELLISTTQTITEVLLASGFDSPRTFNRVFKKFYGMTPNEYRFSASKMTASN